MAREQNQQNTRNTLSAAGRRGAWRRWHRERSIVELMPLVQRLARDARRLFAQHIDVRDLEGAGALGLVKAADAYDPALGQFAAYAWFRVRGSIIDSQKRRAYRDETNASLTALAGSTSDRAGWFDTDGSPFPDAIAARAQLQGRVLQAIDALPELDRDVLIVHMAIDGTNADTAAAVGRSVTWTRGVLARARAGIREELKYRALDEIRAAFR